MTPWTVACRLLCPWDSPGRNTGVVCHFLLQGLNPGLLHCREIPHWLCPRAQERAWTKPLQWFLSEDQKILLLQVLKCIWGPLCALLGQSSVNFNEYLSGGSTLHERCTALGKWNRKSYVTKGIWHCLSRAGAHHSTGFPVGEHRLSGCAASVCGGLDTVQSPVLSHMQNQGSQRQGSCSLDIVLTDGFPDPQAASLGFSGGSNCKESSCNTGDLGSIPGSGEHPGEGKGNPLQDCGLVNSTDRGAWWATVHVVRKSGTWLHLPQVASLPFGDTLRAFHLLWWLEATRAFLLDSSSVSFEGRCLLSLDLLQVLQGLLVFILDLSSPGKHSLHPSKKSGTAEPPEDLL